MSGGHPHLGRFHGSISTSLGVAAEAIWFLKPSFHTKC
jgi:hypothetical protein